MITKYRDKVKDAVRSLKVTYEPSLSTETGARAFLAHARSLSSAQEEIEVERVKKDSAEPGVRFYLIFAGSVLVFFVLPLTVARGPEGGVRLGRVALIWFGIAVTIYGLWFIKMIFTSGAIWLLGGRLIASAHATAPTESITAPMNEATGAAEVTLKKCAAEAKHLIDAVNDRVGWMNHAFSYFTPAMLFYIVVVEILTGSPNDHLSPSLITFGVTLMYGVVVFLFALPYRFLAYVRVREYRGWLRQIESTLLDPTDIS